MIYLHKLLSGNITRKIRHRFQRSTEFLECRPLRRLKHQSKRETDKQTNSLLNGNSPSTNRLLNRPHGVVL